jgi:hypothetical protein
MALKKNENSIAASIPGNYKPALLLAYAVYDPASSRRYLRHCIPRRDQSNTSIDRIEGFTAGRNFYGSG